MGENTDTDEENEQEELEEDKIVLSLKEILSINIKSASRGKYPLSILMLTLMNVSESNVQERKIVSTIIKALKTKLRETDIIIKYASDNILVILPFADASGVTTVHEKIKQLIYDNTFLNEQSKGHILSSSYVTFPEDGKHQEHLLAKLQSKLQPILVFLDEDIL